MKIPACSDPNTDVPHSIVLGGAGFIGTNLVRTLLMNKHRVTVIDNLSQGRTELLSDFEEMTSFRFIQADLSVKGQCEAAFQVATENPVDEIWHLAANSDIPAGVTDSAVDLKDTFLTTYETLRCMRLFGIKNIHFASSSAVYGDWMEVPLHESLGPLRPISNYGAMKLASEAQICASAESFLDQANIFRFPNVVGIPATHGVLYDFIGRLKKDPSKLDVLGNGTQQKSYLHVSDLVSAMLTVRNRRTGPRVEIVNIGATDAGVTVRWIAEQVVARVNPGAAIVFGESNRGWVGDVPKFQYSTERIQSYDWVPTMGSRAAVIRSINEIAQEFDL
ncbi:MAG: SDR family NAD(P)-dependent oxidoreductase [Gallionellaceae bacterium]